MATPCAARICGSSPPPAARKTRTVPDSYNRYFFDAFLPPYEQTAALCGMRFLPPLILHGAHKASNAELAAHAETYVGKLASYPGWPEMDTLEPCVDCEVPLTARPIENVMEAV